MSNEISGPNPGRYRRLMEPFDDHAEANDAIKKFFEGVAKLREEYGIPDVYLILECSTGVAESRGDASLYLGDQAHKMPMLARAYGAARAEHEDNLRAFIAAGREDFNQRSAR